MVHRRAITQGGADASSDGEAARGEGEIRSGMMTMTSKAVINAMEQAMNIAEMFSLTSQYRMVMILRVDGHLDGQLDYRKLQDLRAVKGVARCYVRHGQNRTIVKVILSKKFKL